MAESTDGAERIAPPPGAAPARPPGRGAAEPPPSDRDGFISLPPAMLDSATHRIAAERAERRVAQPPADEVVFFPGAPGAAVPSPTVDGAATSSPAPSSEPVTSAAVEPAPSGTAAAGPVPAAPARVAPPAPSAPAGAGAGRAARAWTLVLGPGEEIGLDGAVLLGRNPAPSDAAPAARLVRVTDPAKSVSKTHALLVPDGGALLVHDIGSTNGVYVVEPGREAVEVRVDHPLRLSGPADLELGSHVLRLRVSAS